MNDDFSDQTSQKPVPALRFIKGIFRKKLFVAVAVTAVCITGILFVYPFFLTGKSSDQSGEQTGFHAGSAEKLKVMTLNIAYGRGTGPHQIRQDESDFRLNLDRTARLIKRENPAVAALQEADGSSFWSGNFNHVAYLVEKTGYPCFFRGEHVRGLGLSYGTAFISGIKLRDSVSVTFTPSGWTPPKGFVKCRIASPWKRDLFIDIVSVHLDFSRSSVRKKQAGELITFLSGTGSPVIVMGDFNCSFTGREDTLRTFIKALDLKAYKPEHEEMATFPRTGKRLDWILISKELDFVSYSVLPDPVSDHFGVIAEVRFLPQ